MYIQNLLWLEVKATGIRHTYFTKKDSKEKEKKKQKMLGDVKRQKRQKKKN